MARIKSYLKDTHPELRAEWDSAKNEKDFDSFATYSHAKVWWICPQNHSYDAMISNRAKGRGCGVCSGKRVLSGFNDLKSQFPELLEEWDYEANTIDPSEIHFGSHTKVHWKCKAHGHKWTTGVVFRTAKHSGTACPTCAGNVLEPGFNDLFSKAPDLASVWSYTKNTIDPTSIRLEHMEPVWWDCLNCSNSWQRRPAIEARREHLCNSCRSGTSSFEREFSAYITDLFPDEEIVFNTKALIAPYEIDVYFPGYNRAIELNGEYWHSDKNLKKSGFSSGRAYHLMKQELCAEKGVELAFLWQDNWDKRDEAFDVVLQDFVLHGKKAEALARLDSHHKSQAGREKFRKVALGRFEEWATTANLFVSFKDLAVGRALIVEEKLAIVPAPRASSSQELRDTQRALKAEGVALYYVHEWESDYTRLTSHFQSKLGLDSRTFAAKRLQLKKIENTVGDAFMAANHIQGSVKAPKKVSLGLFTSDGELLAVQQFSKYRFARKKGDTWEGLRLCFKPGVKIHGAASRFQKYFEKKYSPNKIVSFINLSHSDGFYKAHQGFKLRSEVNSFMWVLEGDPKLVRVIDRNGKERTNDLDECLKMRVLNPNKVAGSFGRGVGQLFFGGKLGSREELSAHEANGGLTNNDAILEAIGYQKVYTAGQAKWEKNLTE